MINHVLNKIFRHIDLLVKILSRSYAKWEPCTTIHLSKKLCWRGRKMGGEVLYDPTAATLVRKVPPYGSFSVEA
jgi:hypothetical protein